MAGMVGRSATAPIDRMRILYITSTQRKFTLRNGFKTMRTIARNTGISGLWRGNGGALLRIIPFSAVSYATFDMTETFFRRHQVLEPGVASRFYAGAFAGLVSTVATYPFDLLRVRLAAHWAQAPLYASYTTAFAEIVRSEGFAGLYAGLGPTVIGILPYAGTSFAVFETLKARLRRWRYARNESLTAYDRLIAGGIAGVVAQTATYPLHVVRRRMQVAPTQYSHWWPAITTIYRSEGLVGGLFKGLSVTWLKGPIAVGISFAANDYFKQLLHRGEVGADLEDDLVASTVLPAEDSQIHTLTTVESLVAGGIAGAVAKTVIAPGDRIKIVYQVDPKRIFSLGSAWRSGRAIVRNHGVTGLWRGNGATMIRVIPSASISYMTFDRYQRLITRLFGIEADVTTRFVAGAAAGATSTLFTYPLDLLRARMAAHWDAKPRYTSYVGAFQQITREEGARALFNGLRPTLLGIVPYAGLSFATFETLKARIRRHYKLRSDGDIPTLLRLTAGGVAGLIAQSATYPLDILRRRLQVHGHAAAPHRGILAMMRHIHNTEGLIRGLYKGLSMNWIKGPIAVAVSFTVNDFLKHQFRKRKEL
eukprot:m.113113 g.113113  ORF g.113113 m.113113 type:complete len:592 (+) comp9415_c2_seq1:814-2589(+)